MSCSKANGCCPCSQGRMAGSKGQYLSDDPDGSPKSLAFTDRRPRPIPFLLMTNGGGVTEDERRKKLGKNFGVEVSLCTERPRDPSSQAPAYARGNRDSKVLMIDSSAQRSLSSHIRRCRTSLTNTDTNLS